MNVDGEYVSTSNDRTGGLDPDPLHVEATYLAGWDDGFERGVADSFPPIRVIALAAFTGLLLGIILTVSTIERLS